MLPKTHALLGLIFSLIIFFIFHITPFYTSLIFFSSVFIDTDHYLWYVIQKKDFNLKKAFYFFKNLKKHPPYLMIFHTLEFFLLILILSFFWKSFFYVFLGMLFHVSLDIIYEINKDVLSCREYFLTRKIFKIIKKNFNDSF